MNYGQWTRIITDQLTMKDEQWTRIIDQWKKNDEQWRRIVDKWIMNN